MRLLLSLVLACICASAVTARAESHTIFLLDVSGSMELPVADEKRIDRAKAALVAPLSSGRYPGAELIMWNTQKFFDDYGDGAKLASQLSAATKGHRGSYLGSAFESISEAGYRCAHVVFVTDEYPDDQGDFTHAINGLLAADRQNTVTIYVVNHPLSNRYAKRFAQVSDSTSYRVVDGNRERSLDAFLTANPATDACGTLS
ncbi:VWA domain-containing protein [Tropicimonas isoalkanivorans]|uniref:VWFA domain-containing protein n=1 Tax=Tropicimonas isoalkanivorans TaxID=441112 RepID=A0A1I1M364_9RHOB|nr:VWA domain-containing protein [Tropicimonas isoalkanivorans]SFC79849.1 hypothetical protein SAMN04488094_109139 [Tropicimonas isoalkanivorans]